MRLRIVRRDVVHGHRVHDIIDFPDVNALAHTALGQIVFAGLESGDTVTVDKLTDAGGIPVAVMPAPTEPPSRFELTIPDVAGLDLGGRLSVPEVVARG